MSPVANRGGNLLVPGGIDAFFSEGDSPSQRSPGGQRVTRPIQFTPIGTVRSEHTSPSETPIQPAFAGGCPGRIELLPEHEEGLSDVEGFSHVIVLYHFDRAGSPSLRVRPFLDNQLRGVFATRHPCRPNAIGLSILHGGAVSVATVTAIFLSNLPEGLSSSAGMRKAGRPAAYVFGVWTAIAVACGLSSLAGYAVFDGLSPFTVAATTAVAAGAILTMVIDTMIPEAFAETHNWAGLIAVLGFLTSFALSQVAG